MSKKFTEEQYHEIIKAWESQSFSLKRVQAVLEIMSINDMPSNINEGLALANPASRELAHEQFVEKEKKFVWSSKKEDRDSNVLTLYIDEYGMVSTSYRKVYENNLRNEDMLITESKIREWGYNPEMFEKKEVQD